MRKFNKLKDRFVTPPGMFSSPPQYGNLKSMSFLDLCRRISKDYKVPLDEALMDEVDRHNAVNLPRNVQNVFCQKDEIPSIKEQGNWEIIDIDSKLLEDKGEFFYNSSIIKKREEFFLIYRMDYSGNAETWVAKLDKNFQPIKETNKKIALPEINSPDIENTKWEDARIFWFNGKMHLSYCLWGGVWVRYPKRFCRIAYTPDICCVELDDDFNFVKEIELNYGNNKKHGWEKNWMFFQHKNELHFIYNVKPFVVCKVTEKGIKEVCRYDWECSWEEHIKGGTPPILIGDKYFSFYHSHEPRFENARNAGRRYNMGVFCFDKNLKITHYSEPFLIASEKDPYLSWAPLVVFPCGSVFENGLWTISMGVHDWYTCLMRIRHEEVTEMLIPVE